MKMLVTGGAGFIGSHIVDALVSAGHAVTVLDNLSSGHRTNLSKVWNAVTFIEGDIRDPEVCLKAAEGCDGIFHEAALVSVPDSIRRPRDNHDINITGTLNILEAARQQNVKRVVFASSAAVYGDNLELPKRESMLPEPKSPYALAKLTGEYYLKVYAECFGLETVALRYFNVFGPRQDPSSMYSGVISIFSERIKNGLPITLYGDGQQTRDFVNVEDVVQANLLAMTTNLLATKSHEKPQEMNHVTGGAKGVGAAFPHQLSTDNQHPFPHNFVVLNVATGTQTSLLDLIAVLGELCGKTPEIRFALSREGDIQHSLADISVAKITMNYEAEICLEQGLRLIMRPQD
ncbi:MAG: SDR family oxidoreductase [Verrucomicrobia bacterium]|nr:SDR family oxidoreductase [Verrucomicrobiota bacterium]